jgi:hypothetical protein
MFSAGAFAAAHLAGAPYEDEALRDTYRELMQERVFDAIGMPSATLDFDEAIASENHAWPNGYDPETDTLKATPVDYERSVMSVAPGGGIWSDISDLARFGVAQLTGATPEGRRVVSQENLAETHRPGVSVADGTRYAMGWFVSEDYPPGDSSGLGQPAVWHSGDTAGFSSHMVLLPEQQLGVVVLSNRFDSGPFCKAVTRFVLETLLGREPTSDADLFAEETDLRSGMRYVFELSTPVDRDTAEPYLGSFEHHARVVFSDQGFALEGEFGPIPLRSLGDPGLFVSSGLLSGAFVAAFDADNETPLLFASPGDDGLEQVLPLARMTANHAQ